MFQQMKLIFSRKGFDSGLGKCPSPIVDGRTQSLPIPTTGQSPTTFADLGLDQRVSTLTSGRISGNAWCHDDPMFGDGWCWFGQSGAAQGHLRKQQVGIGDIFLFFGLFADPVTSERHHRIFGYLKVSEHGPTSAIRQAASWREPVRPHPHFFGDRSTNDTIYHGPAASGAPATAALRLTVAGGPLSLWSVPKWLGKHGLTYHGKPWRWQEGNRLQTVAKGQEFVCDIGDNPEPREWLNGIIAEIER